MFKVGDKVIRTDINDFWKGVLLRQNKEKRVVFTVKGIDENGQLALIGLNGSFCPDGFAKIKPKLRNIIKYQVFDTQLNKPVTTFDTLEEAEEKVNKLNKVSINIGEEFENGNIAVKVENVDLVSEEVEVVIYHCGQPFYSSYDLGKFLREFKKCVQ